MPLYMCQPPTGYKDTADAWVNTGALRQPHELRAAARVRTGAEARGVRTGTQRRSATLLAGDVSDDDARDASRRRPTRRRRLALDARRAGIPAEMRFEIVRFQMEVRMISRRVFLKNGAPALRQPRLRAVVPGAHRGRGRGAARRKLLIAIFQRGAVDGLNMIVPLRRARLLPRAADHRDPAARRRRRRARSISTASSASTRAAARSSRCGTRRELAIVHACGSPDSTRSHFDAQDYMESGTPGVKSTQDGWLNRYLQARARRAATPFRAVALDAAAAAHRCRAARRRSPMSQIGAVRHPRRPVERHGRRVVRGASTPRPPTRVLNGTGREAFDAIKMLKAADPAKYQPAQRRRLSAQRASARRCSRSRSSSRPTSASRSRSPTSAAGTPTSTRDAAQGQLADAARRFRARHRRARHATSAIAWRTS